MDERAAGGWLCPYCETLLIRPHRQCPACGSAVSMPQGFDEPPASAPAPTPAPAGRPLVGPGSLASIGSRAAGAFIDGLLFAPLSLFVYFRSPTHLEERTSVSGRVSTVTVHDHRSLALSLVLLLPGVIYVIVAIGRWGRTIGQRVMGLRVVRIDGERPGFTEASRRWAAVGIVAVMGSVLYLTYLSAIVNIVVLGWMLRDKNRQGLHDKFAGVVVLNA